MKTNIHLKKGSRLAGSPYSLNLKHFLFSAIILTAFVSQTPLKAQEVQYTKPSLWIGAAVGANFNYYRGTTQNLNDDLTVPAAFRHGNGTGLYLAPLIEYYRPDSRLGLMFPGRV